VGEIIYILFSENAMKHGHCLD